MNTFLTQKQIGERIRQLRKNKGFSQEELSQNIHISRSALAQIEQGNRSIDAVELQKFSFELNFSLDAFYSNNFLKEDTKLKASKKKKNEPEIRIAIPKFKTDKFKNVLLYILERCAGKPNVGETVLYKLLYFCDFNYYEIHEEHLIGAIYEKMKFGPVPRKINSIIDSMIEEKLLQKISTTYHDHNQKRYIPLAKADLSTLKASEKDVIDKVIDQMGDWTATTISDYSHKDIPWLASDDNKIISYELVFYRDAPYSVRNYDNEC